jgi:hypothetical protein
MYKGQGCLGLPAPGPFSNWTSYTPIISPGFGVSTSISAQWRREGDSIRVRFYFVSGTDAASPGSISLPNGMLIDNTKVLQPANTTIVGQVIFVSGGFWTASNWALLFLDGSNTTQVFCTWTASSNVFVKGNVSTFAGSNAGWMGEFLVPIIGLSV